MIEVCLRQKPEGAITERDFAVIDRSEPATALGNVLTRTTWISLDPYLALRMRKEIPAQECGAPFPIVGRTIGVVIDPGASAFAAGDTVLGFGRWSAFDARPASELRKIDIEGVPVSAHLGALGHSGFTAWLGLRLAKPESGETVLISGAAGAVGGVAGQLAKAVGCRVIGIAGGREKTEWVKDHLSFDACADHRKPDLETQIAAFAPHGVDIHFENVGATTLDPALANMRRRGRIVLCGLVQHYQDIAPVSLKQFRRFLEGSIRLEPFSIYDYQDLFPQAHAELAAAAKAGRLRFTETVSEGIENAPAAFLAMLAGRGMGKHVVKIG